MTFCVLLNQCWVFLPTLSSQLRWCAPQPLLNKPTISQAECPTPVLSGLCACFRQDYQLFYFCFVTFLATDLSAFNSPWHLYGHIKTQKCLEAIFRCRQGFLSSQSGVETGHHGFHGGQGTVLSRVEALGHTITSSLFVFLPSFLPLILSILSMLKRSFLAVLPRLTRLWRQPSIDSTWVSSPVVNRFLWAHRVQSWARILQDTWGYILLERLAAPKFPFMASFHVVQVSFLVRSVPHCKIRSSWEDKRGCNSSLAEVLATDYSLRVLLLVVGEVSVLLDMTVKCKKKYITVLNMIHRITVIA